MKNKKYILKIEDPCSEDWQTMDEEEISRFCNKCQKSVINFADMSDKEIYNYLEKSDSKICGRFKNEQLNRPIINPNYNPNYHEKSKYLPILAGMLLMTGNEIANATDSTSTNKVSSYITPSSSPDSTKAITKSDSVEKAENKEEYYIIKGSVKDEENKPIFGAIIRVKGTTFGDKSDKDGNFTIKIPKKSCTENIKLTSTYVGLQEAELVVKHRDLKSKNQINIKLKNKTIIFGMTKISNYDESEISHPNIHIIKPGK
jgi:hypothetical protein